jgi:NifU-like protein involved in Fe-S cluster formation
MFMSTLPDSNIDAGADLMGRAAKIAEMLLISIVHCSLLAEDAIKSAIKDYQTKREKRLAMAAVSSLP